MAYQGEDSKLSNGPTPTPTTAQTATGNDTAEQNQPAGDDGNDVAVAMPFRPHYFKIHSKYTGSAIHEKLTIAAIKRSHFKDDFGPTERGTTLGEAFAKSNTQWDLLRGVLWNDDPSCLLFNDNSGDNHELSDGAEWGLQFTIGPSYSTTQRTHYGDLQFLHSMAADVGEWPEVTKWKINHWITAMYALYIGEYNGDTKMKDTTLSTIFDRDRDTLYTRGGGKIMDRVRSLIPPVPLPNVIFWPENDVVDGETTFRELFTARTPSYPADLQLRALGSALHIVQDSFAHGHTKRAGQGQDGDILNFHCYKDQDHTAHGHADEDGADHMNTDDYNSFKDIPGGQAAIDASVRLINAFYDGKKNHLIWAKGNPSVYDVFMDIFKLGDKATQADNSV